MAFGSRIYSATSVVSFSTADVIMELQCPIDIGIELIRAWCVVTANGAPLIEEVQPICIYGNDAPQTGGNGMIEQKQQSGGSANAEVTAKVQGTIGASPIDFYCDAFLARDGWEYYPVPEERIWIRGNTTLQIPDNIGIRFPVAPAVLTFFNVGMTWAEFS